MWLELPEGVDALELHRLALSQDISVAPGHLFSADHRFSHHLRINFGHPEKSAADTLDDAIGVALMYLVSQDWMRTEWPPLRSTVPGG